MYFIYVMPEEYSQELKMFVVFPLKPDSTVYIYVLWINSLQQCNSLCVCVCVCVSMCIPRHTHIFILAHTYTQSNLYITAIQGAL